MSKVFLVQEPLKRDERGEVVPRINYNTLRPYGDVEFLFEWGELKDADVLTDTDRYLDTLRDKLAEFCDDDYLVLMGNPALCSMAMAIAAEMNDGVVNMLDWLRNERRYRIVHVDLGPYELING